jgi:hypothetical protein
VFFSLFRVEQVWQSAQGALKQLCERAQFAAAAEIVEGVLASLLPAETLASLLPVRAAWGLRFPQKLHPL